MFFKFGVRRRTSVGNYSLFAVSASLLYDNLIMLENIKFYGGVYGVSRPEIKQRSSVLVATLGLEKEAKKLVGELPLGWKQKLAFSVAIFDRPKIVFLDEPIGGVDPLTRRQFWDVIYRV
ncbi:ATP-binding cassette domain-containing protein [Mucilaginibacter sp.]|uniref:ATP-binding cassette domain-containing protein n=1 Tax=Mucilaginibacter sp. TaxID=1882438 RepID=UPI00326623F6